MIGDQLQRAIFSALVEASISDGRIYDQPDPGAAFPYVTIGDEQVINDGTSCAEAWEVFADVHVWSRPVSGSKSEVKSLAASIVPILAKTLTVSGFVVVIGDLESARTIRDPDGRTEHSILTFRYLLDEV